MKPTPTLLGRRSAGQRIRFTTKEVGRGFYRGTRTGSMGAHTPHGGYLIDWRKVRHFNVPDLKGFTLTPYVSKEIEVPEKKYTKRINDGMSYLRLWRERNEREYEWIWNHQLGVVSEEEAEARRIEEAENKQVEEQKEASKA